MDPGLCAIQQGKAVSSLKRRASILGAICLALVLLQEAISGAPLIVRASDAAFFSATFFAALVLIHARISAARKLLASFALLALATGIFLLLKSTTMPKFDVWPAHILLHRFAASGLGIGIMSAFVILSVWIIDALFRRVS